jgi:multiple sugar transport system permease protein
MKSTSTGSGSPLLRHAVRELLFYLLVVVILIPAAFVFFWMVSSSFKRQVDIYAIPPLWLRFDATLNNYTAAFERTPFLRYALNSTIVAVGSSLLGLAIGLPAAYSIARYRQNRMAILLLTARLMPGVAYLVPLFLLFSSMKLVGTYPALIFSHLVVTFPLTVYMMVSFFEGIPRDLYDAAMIDGCNKWGVFWRVALPLTKPGMVTAAILAFIFSWNDFKMALILSNSSTRTLPVAVYNFIHEASLDWGPMMAYATIITIPVLLLTLFVQRNIVTGMTMGSVK